MSKGEKLSISEAKANILAFENYILPLDQAVPRRQLAIGQKLDLQVLKNFMMAIEQHSRGHEVDAVRIYFARSTRDGDSEERFDIVLLPVFQDDTDFHVVYDRLPLSDKQDTIIGRTLPCPNVCPSPFEKITC